MYRKLKELELIMFDKNTSKQAIIEKISEVLDSDEIKNPLHFGLENIKEYCFKIIRNTDREWWELEIGIPSSWEVKDNKKIACNVLQENEIGKHLHIYPKKEMVLIDDLVLFVNIIIKTNEEIAKKEKEFSDKIKKMKEGLENEVKSFYEKLERDKISAFENLQNNLELEFNEKKTKESPKKQEVKEKPDNTETNDDENTEEKNTE